MDRRNFVKSAGGLILMAGATPWPQALAETLSKSPKGKRPMNLLFMTADDMNGSMPGWMGNPLKPTPNMDAFAATAHRFVDNHDAAPICQPSREAMMTGLWPQRSGGLGFNPINAGVPTLATVLKENGYFIAAFNKLEHMQPASCFPWDYSTNDSGPNPPMIEDQVAEAIKRARAQEKPFFINCNMRDPHRPWPKLNDKADVEGEGEHWIRNGSPIDDVARKITPEQVMVPSFLEDLQPIREELATYHNSVQRLDLSFGKVLPDNVPLMYVFVYAPCPCNIRRKSMSNLPHLAVPSAGPRPRFYWAPLRRAFARFQCAATAGSMRALMKTPPTTDLAWNPFCRPVTVS